MAENKLILSSSPHFKTKVNTQSIMLCVLISLLPECVAGVVFFGWRALVTILVSVASCVLGEYLFQKLTKQKVVINNLSAAVTGVLLALVCPSTTPWWMIVLGALVAVVVAKGLFGGIGSNVFNPALTGRAFLFISFPSVLGASWTAPFAKGADAVSSATVLSQIKAGAFEPAAADLWNYFIGNQAGCIGETSALLILISFAFLLVCHIIDWRAPLGMLLTFACATFITALAKGGSALDAGFAVLTGLCTGGVLFGATFMITDYATSPITKPGRLIFGAGAGLITYLIRQFGGYPEGVMFSILIMNAVAPFLNNLTPRMYGYGKKGSKLPEVEKIDGEFGLDGFVETSSYKGGEA